MTWTRSTERSTNRRRVLVGLSLALLLCAGSVARAQQSAGQGRTLAGVWYVEVTIRDCNNGDALAPPVRSLVTFASDGTMRESVGGGGFAPGQRSDGHGTWTHNGGRTYDQNFVAMINFATAPGPGPGFEAGWIKVHHTVELLDANRIASSGTNTFYRINGEQYRSGCSTATGRRFE